MGHAPFRRDQTERRPRHSAPGTNCRRRQSRLYRRQRQSTRPAFGVRAVDRSRAWIRGYRAMSAAIAHDKPAGFSFAQYLTCMNGIVWREGLRFVHQRERFISALVRPLVWLFIFAAGFRQVLGISIIPP